MAATAVASGVEVSLWLTGDAVWLAVPGRAEQLTLPHAAALADLRDALLEGASVTVCGQCAARRELAPEDLFGQVTIRGAQRSSRRSWPRAPGRWSTDGNSAGSVRSARADAPRLSGTARLSGTVRLSGTG